MVTLRVMNGETESWAIEGVGGGDIPGLAIPAFTLRRPAGAPIPVVIAAPHGGRAYPEALTDRMRDPAFASLRLEDRHVDRMADAVAAATGAAFDASPTAAVNASGKETCCVHGMSMALQLNSAETTAIVHPPVYMAASRIRMSGSGRVECRAGFGPSCALCGAPSSACP